MQTKPILVVMAAGMGSRYGGLKQIDPVGPSGEAILDYSLYDARRAGFKTVVFIIKHEIEQAFKEPSVPVPYAPGSRSATPTSSWKSCPRLHRAGGPRQTLGHRPCHPRGRGAIGDAPFAVINADDYYGPQASSSSTTT